MNVIFGKLSISKEKPGSMLSDFLYNYSNTMKQALAWTRKLSEEVISKRGRKKETLFWWYFGEVL